MVLGDSLLLFFLVIRCIGLDPCDHMSFYEKLLMFDHFKTAYITTQPAITCSKLTIKTLGQGVKYVQS